MQFSFIWPIDRTLSGTIAPNLSGPGSDSNEGVLRIPKSFSITATSPSDCLGSYPGHSLEVGVIPLNRNAVGAFYSSSWLGKFPNLGLKTRPIINKQEEKSYQVDDLAIPVDHRVKIKESKKTDKYLDITRGQQKLWNTKVTLIQL